MRIDALLEYLRSLARPDGGYGWEDQPDSHLTPTFAAIGCYHLLGRPVPNPAAAAEFIRTHHPLRGPYAETGASELDLRSFLLQQIQALQWLGEDVSAFAGEVRSWQGPGTYLYEVRKYPVLREEAFACVGRRLLGLPVDDLKSQLLPYFTERRRPNGSFNSTRAEDGGDGHVQNTWWALLALEALGCDPAHDALAEATVRWLQACRHPAGGFTYQPQAQVGGVDDVAYTRAALRALALLGAWPDDRDGCLQYLLSLQNLDGGFGDRPGMPSNPQATYEALDALAALGALDMLERLPHPARPAEATGATAAAGAPGAIGTAAAPQVPNASPGPVNRPAAKLRPGLRAFTVQIEAPGWGSPVEAVELARSLRIDLWGAKNAAPGWIDRAQAVADERGVPVRFFVSNEEYGSYIELPGMGCYNHLSDPFAPHGTDFGPNLRGEQPHWEEFRRRRLEPLWRAGGRMLWQISHDEPFTRALLDDSLERGGYGAISTFHFGCSNMAYTVPLLFRYRHAIPFVSLQDAHGSESWWWSHHLAGFRTLFLAEEPTWEAWLEALERQWVVAVRHDHRTYYRTRMLGGGPGVQERVRELEPEWRWWHPDEPTRLIRPFASLVAVRAADEFEAGRPEEGAVALRLRLWWHATHLAHLLEPLVEVLSFEVDGRPVVPEPVRVRNDKGKLVDAYEKVTLPADGREHAAVAVVRQVQTGETAEVRCVFTA